MAEPTRSISDIAEQLMHEFHGVFAVSTVTQVVIRLSRDGAVTLSDLAAMARNELSTLATAPPATAGDVSEVVAP